MLSECSGVRRNAGIGPGANRMSQRGANEPLNVE